MSKSLKKLIDINRLREFKNKLVGTGSAYVQTAAVDQTVAGTKTFSEPIVGSVTGSSGSCTGNAATATTAATASSVPWSGVTGKPSSYTPAAHTQAASTITGLATVATSGSYKDLTNKPAIPTVNNATLTIQKNGTTVKTFTANASANVTANITVPTKVSELTNDSGFLTSHQSLSNYVTLNGAQTISGAKTFTGDVIGISKDNSTENANDLYSTTAGSKLTYYTTSNGFTRLTNVPAAVNTTLESRTIRKLSDSDWVVEQICHNSNGLYYRKGINGTWGAWKTFAFTDSNISGNAATATTATTAKACTGNAATATTATTAQACTGNAATATKLAAKRTIALSGAATGTATGFDGSGNITIPVTSLDASKLTGTASVSTTGNAATATTATTATNATTAKACTGNAATATKLATARSLWGNNFDGSAAISGTITGTPAIEFKPTATTSNNGGLLDFHYNQSTADYTSRIIESASGTLSINNVTITTGKVVTATTFNGALKGNVTGNCSGSSGSCTGNAASANIATKATQDAAGNTITTTYATKAENNTKANNSEVVHKSGDETIAGTKTFSNGVLITNVTGLMVQNGEYTLVLRNDGSNTYLLMSDKGGVPGTWSDARPLTISNSRGVCDINGNADTATKLATARTIALSGAATGTATSFDGSGNITIPVTALSPSAIRAQWYAAYPDGPEAHNAMWGGRDITAAFNNGTFSANVANGTFRDIFPGDYITKAVTIYGNGTPGMTYTVNWVIADCDYWINKGDTGMTTHHVAIVPQQPIFDANMNATNTTEGGYKGSVMYRSIIRASVTGGIVSAFGSDHILTFRDAISNSVDTSHVSSGIPQWTGTPGWWGEWVSVQCNLMSEKMVYGAPICAAGAMDNVMATRQMSAFRLSERLINYNRQWWWLRDVVSSASFARVNGYGDANASYASDAIGVRPFALLR